MIHYYKLVHRKPVPLADEMEAAKAFSGRNMNQRRIRSHYYGDVQVSTVFLVIDHNSSDTGRPVLFETMIFGGKHDGYQTRCCTHRDALGMHKVARWVAEGKVDPAW